MFHPKLAPCWTSFSPLSAMFLALLASPVAFAQQPPASKQAQNYGTLPLGFEANQGQSDPQVKFLSRGNGYSLFLTGNAAVLSLTRINQPPSDEPAANGNAAPTFGETISSLKAARARLGNNPTPEPAPRKTDILSMEIAGASANPQVTGAEQLPGVANYFIGNDSSKWHTNVPTYAKVSYKDVYPGIDLVYYGNQRQLEYDFVVAPGADPNAVHLHFAGAEKLSLTPDGDLLVAAKNGQIAFHKPVVYQQAATTLNQREPIDGKFVLLAGNIVGFTVGSYDHERQLVIDPTLVYSTYLGGSGYHIPAGPDCCGDVGTAIAYDSAGNAYITGETGSTDFPVVGAFQKTNSRGDSNGNAFVSKLNSTGTALIYSTYLGGSGNYSFGDYGKAIAVNSAGEAYVAGYTSSTNFPTKNPYQSVNHTSTNQAYTGFVTKLNATGNALIYSTYLGGSGLGNCCGEAFGDRVQAIALDPADDALVAGTTYSKDFPITVGAYQQQNNANAINGSSIFLTKVNPEGSALVYSTYLGGSGYNEGCCYFFSSGDYGSAVAADGTGSAYVAGYAWSKDFPVTSDAFQKTNNAKNSLNNTGSSNYNAVISKFTPTGQLLYSTYLGGTGNPYYGDLAAGIAVDPSCHVYIAGYAGSIDFPTTKGALQPAVKIPANHVAGFVTRLNAELSGLDYSTYLSGTGSNFIGDDGSVGDNITGISVDGSGHVYVTGVAQSVDFPVTGNGLQKTNKETGLTGTAFISEFNPGGSALSYSSYWGGSGGDVSSAIAVDPSSNAYITGNTLSSNFPVSTTAFQKVNNAVAAGNSGSTNAFVAKFNIGGATAPSATQASITADANPAAEDELVTFTAYISQNTACGFPPTGTATFTIDGGTPIPVKVDDTGHAIYQTSTLVTGTHTIDVSYSGDPKYSTSTATYKETITTPPATLAIVAGSGQTSVYGTAYKTPLTVLVKDAKGNPSPGVIITFTGTGLKFSSPTAITASNGEASVTATPTAIGTLKATASAEDVKATVTFDLTATKAVLTVTAKNVSVPYGQPIPPLTYTLTGFVNGDSKSVVTGAPTETTTAKQDSPVGTYPITITAGTLTATDYTFKFVNGTVTITSLGTTATPTFSPAAGTYSGTQKVTLADATSGATIYFTLTGATPTTSSTKYTSPISVGVSKTIKAIAAAPGYANSAVASATYTIK